MISGTRSHVDPSVGKTLGLFEVTVPFETDPCHDLMGRPIQMPLDEPTSSHLSHSFHIPCISTKEREIEH